MTVGTSSYLRLACVCAALACAQCWHAHGGAHHLHIQMPCTCQRRAIDTDRRFLALVGCCLPRAISPKLTAPPTATLRVFHRSIPVRGFRWQLCHPHTRLRSWSLETGRFCYGRALRTALPQLPSRILLHWGWCCFLFGQPALDQHFPTVQPLPPGSRGEFGGSRCRLSYYSGS